MKKRSSKSIIWTFWDEHPTLRRCFDTIADFADRLMVVYFGLAISLVAIIVIILYFSLPEGIRSDLATVIGAVLSVIISPLIIKAIDREKERRCKRFETNEALYNELSEILVELIIKKEVDAGLKKLKDFLKKNYNVMCLYFSPSLISNIYSTYRACKNSQEQNLIYYAQKCIGEMRKEFGSDKRFILSSIVLDELRDENDGEEPKVANIDE